jgi:SH3 domain-containing YSC84-like protein 1
MKKPLFLLALACSLLVAPLHAQRALPREDYVIRLETCEAILREFMADPATAIPAHVLREARGLIIINQFKGGFLLGVQDGWGVIMVRRPDGSWSVPGILTAGELSIGLQAGASSIETVMVLMDEAPVRKIFHQRFNAAVDAKAVGGPRAAETERANTELLDAEVLVYRKSRGLFAGATLRTGWVQRNDPANRVFFGTHHALPEILYSDWVQPPVEALPLMEFVQSITR